MFMCTISENYNVLNTILLFMHQNYTGIYYTSYTNPFAAMVIDMTCWNSVRSLK